MNGFDIIFDQMYLRSFSSLWFWLALVAVWALASHRVLGVSSDMIRHARKYGGPAEADLEALVQIKVARLRRIFDEAGVVIVGMLFFVLSSLALLGFYHGVELAQAMTLIVVPLTWVGFLNLRLVRQVQAGNATGAGLVRLLGRHRHKVQAIGLFSIFATTMWGAWQNAQAGFPGF
ncbi:MAG: component of SufBCD complex [Rhodobacter sp.]|nr:component of SufBCD complex [Rhodobacter sp.]MCA3511902.1 component of SufBCD complex [Rhodobacter sp.]MCA3519074.1 component of SufBCD complex [Rhodobacter sp.]MCA3522355.1 component of SufBCD complex [Rhodobacter sp.]MCA3525139.1 component of SufBCD complex [Rhodobacter sp.]